ncbi:UNVERIFIED_CONTAM: hypothetical protein GTU68_002108 [Idotea baltica]|nr:hypothetical protein [Idotea baltica]
MTSRVNIGYSSSILLISLLYAQPRSLSFQRRPNYLEKLTVKFWDAPLIPISATWSIPRSPSLKVGSEISISLSSRI